MRPISIVITAILLVAAAQSFAADRPVRVLSLSVCVDQYLIALADKDQIVALSSYARNPLLSYDAVQARDYPVSKGTVEEALVLKPDLVISGLGWQQLVIAQLRKRGVSVVEVDSAESYQAIVEQTRLIAGLVGHADRGEALIARMNAELAAIPTRTGPHPEAAYYQRRGFLNGTGTLIDEIMRRAGLTNIATRLGRTSVSKMPLELIVQVKPEYLILESDADILPDNGESMLAHPALDKAVPPARRLYLPEAITVCGGPFFPEAVRQLAAQIRP